MSHIKPKAVLRDSGVSTLGNIPWGTHICQFYQTQHDLLDILIPYFTAGIKNHEYCIWITPKTLTVGAAITALTKAIPNLNRYLASHQIELLPYDKWYLHNNLFDSNYVLKNWEEKYHNALAKGYAGMRVASNIQCLRKKFWKEFLIYEKAINTHIIGRKILAISTYFLDKLQGAEIVQIVNLHQYALAIQDGCWEVLENIEHNRSLQALTKTNTQYRYLFNSLTEGFAYCDIICDKNGVPRDYRFVEANPALVDIIGLERKAIIGKTHYEVFENDHQEWIKIFGDVALTGKSAHIASHSDDGKTYYEIYAFSPARYQFAVIVVNITHSKRLEKQLLEAQERLEAKVNKRTIELANTVTALKTEMVNRKKLEHQLLHAQKMESIGTLAGGVAHDFNNLLTVISGYGQILERNIPSGNEMLRTSVNELLKATNRAHELTKNLLTFSRQQISNPKPACINYIINNSLSFMRRIVDDTIKIKLKLSRRKLPVLVDIYQMEHVLLNLAGNARDAMPNGGTLLISTSQINIKSGNELLYGLTKPGKYAVTSFTDDGIGINEKVIPRIFEPFFTTKKVGKGTGLGLSIVYGITKQHEGSVSVKSKLHEGTTFSIYLPMIAR